MDIQLHGQQITVSWRQSGTSEFDIKLYVDGELRDSSGWITVNNADWRTTVRASVLNASGQKKELQFQSRYLGGGFEDRFLYEGEIVALYEHPKNKIGWF